MGMSSDVHAVGELGHDLSRLIGNGTLPPEDGESLRSPVGLAWWLAASPVARSVTSR